MIRWFRKQSSVRRKLPQRAALSVESLEGRDCPSAPALTAFSVTDLGDHVVALAGTVSDENPATAVVTITTPSQSNVNAQVQSNGAFYCTAEIAALGEFSARALDDESLYSDFGTFDFSVDAPVLTITAVTQGDGQEVTVTGVVDAAFPGGLEVALSGVVDGTATVNSDGTFSYTGEALGPGTVLADVTDIWDQQAEQATENLVNDAPVIEDFEAVPIDEDTYEFRGHVSDEHAAGLTVTLAGLPSLGSNGVQVTVDANGDFAYQMNVTADDFGTVTANLSDAWGDSAQEASLDFNLSETSGSAISVTSITQGANRSVTVNGVVSGENVSGLTVTLNGVLSGQTTTNSSGNFTFTGTASAAGAIQITTTDGQNNTSDPVTVMLNNAVPVINQLRVVAINRGTTYEIRGRVSDEWAAGLTVNLRGLPSLGTNGVNVTVSSAGTFVYRFNVQRDSNGAIIDVGNITASMADWFDEAAQNKIFRFVP